MKNKNIILTGSVCAISFVFATGFYYYRDIAKVKSTPTKRNLILNDLEIKNKKNDAESSVVMNDPNIPQAWGLEKTLANKAWSVSQGDKGIVVAVIDTGADVNHEDLSNNIWTNPGETGLDKNGKDKASNDIDDDGNGFVDDVHGWNFVSNNNSLTDNHGHGTHVSGIIGAEAGNNKGIAGISPKVSLMQLKYFDPKVPNTDNLKNTIAAIKYAIKMKVNIINYSGGGTEYSKEEFEAVQEAQKNGILFVAAAGNERSNSDHNKYYPADYGLTNIISVTAIDPSTEVLPSSNYGIQTVDIAAPGQGILSTLPNNNYGTMTGTSQATAFVTGAAVLFMAHRKVNEPEKIKEYILSTGDSQSSLLAKTKTSKKLNLFRVLTSLDTGVSVNGIIAANTINIPQISTRNANQEDPNVKISNFSKDLVQILNKVRLSETN